MMMMLSTPVWCWWLLLMISAVDGKNKNSAVAVPDDEWVHLPNRCEGINYLYDKIAIFGSINRRLNGRVKMV